MGLVQVLHDFLLLLLTQESTPYRWCLGSGLEDQGDHQAAGRGPAPARPAAR
jgi:hypothetical protein